MVTTRSPLGGLRPRLVCLVYASAGLVATSRMTVSISRSVMLRHASATHSFSVSSVMLSPLGGLRPRLVFLVYSVVMPRSYRSSFRTWELWL